MLDSAKAATPQPSPNPGQIDVAPIVLRDIQARIDAGRLKYGTALQTFNGRSAMWDLYQELIDACMYVRQCLLEDEWKAIESAMTGMENGAQNYERQRDKSTSTD